jgi:hypothetical protein
LRLDEAESFFLTTTVDSDSFFTLGGGSGLLLSLGAAKVMGSLVEADFDDEGTGERLLAENDVGTSTDGFGRAWVKSQGC